VDERISKRYARYEIIKSTYNWANVGDRSERVYQEVSEKPRLSVLGRIKMELSIGPIVGLLNVLFYLLTDLIWVGILDWWHPEIEKAEEFDFQKYNSRGKGSFGDHEERLGDSKLRRGRRFELTTNND